jgi:hypothetical protein
VNAASQPSLQIFEGINVVLFDRSFHSRVIPVMSSFCFGAAQGLPKVSTTIEADENKRDPFREHNLNLYKLPIQ